MKRRYSKLYMSDFLKELEYEHGKQFVEDFKKTYYYQKLSQTLSESRTLYKYSSVKVKSSFLVRLTFPFYIIVALLYGALVRPLYWLFKGKPLFLDDLPKFSNFIKNWDDKGGFNIF